LTAPVFVFIASKFTSVASPPALIAPLPVMVASFVAPIAPYFLYVIQDFAACLGQEGS
jgi:hypothetical protein